MKPKLLCFFVFLHICVYSWADNNLRLGDIRSLGMSGNEVVESALFNPALVALSKERALEFNYFNRYGLKELGTVSGAFWFPNDLLSVGFNYASFGYEKYRESLFRLSLGKQLSKQWTLGISAQYALLQTELYEEQPAQVSTDIGLTCSPVDNLLIGLLIMNFPSVSLGDKQIVVEDFIEYVIQVGFQWEIINNLLISSTVELTEDHKLAGSIGVEYIPFDTFCIRIGVGGSPFLPSFGIGYGFSRFTVNVAAIYHAVLGVSTGLGITFTF